MLLFGRRTLTDSDTFAFGESAVVMTSFDVKTLHTVLMLSGFGIGTAELTPLSGATARSALTTPTCFKGGLDTEIRFTSLSTLMELDARGSGNKICDMITYESDLEYIKQVLAVNHFYQSL